MGGTSSIQRRQLLGMIGGGALVAGCAGSPPRATRAEVYAILPAGEVVPVVRVKGCEQQWVRPESHDSFISFDNRVSYYP